jgi:hypothetical protein
MFDFRAWLRKTFTPIVGASACAAIMTGQANAGNIILTGHDDDYHDRYDDLSIANPKNQPGQQLLAMYNFARNGSPNAKVLVIDTAAPPNGAPGNEMVTSFNALVGAANVTAVDPTNKAALDAALLDPNLAKKYSVIAIASATNCGGCDNTIPGYNNIAADKAALAAFINTAGNQNGVLQTTGGTTSASRNAAYAWLPKTAGAPAGVPPSTGYFQTPAGAANSIPAVNGDATHNLFFEPGTSGESPAWIVMERLRNPDGSTSPETIGIASAHVGTTTITGGTPEPTTLGLAAMGLAGLAGYRLRKRGKK